MLAETIPLCYENGTWRDIQDEEPSICQISGKRFDSNWAEWNDFVVIDDGHVWKRISNRSCGRELHGGLFNCFGDSENILEWYSFHPSSSVTWDAAVLNCEAKGGL